jgi:proteasome lid subunit RPN8/RPN11
MKEDILDELEEKESIFKKILVVLVAIFLLFLVLSYILASYPLFPIIASLSESKIAENETIKLEDFSIIFTEGTYEELQEIYHLDQSVEMAACLKGEYNQDYIIDEVYQPEIFEQTFNHVSFKACSQDTLILLHSHPFRRCIASSQDLQTLENIKQRNPDSIMVIMCEPDRFSIYE